MRTDIRCFVMIVVYTLIASPAIAQDAPVEVTPFVALGSTGASPVGVAAVRSKSDRCHDDGIGRVAHNFQGAPGQRCAESTDRRLRSRNDGRESANHGRDRRRPTDVGGYEP